MERRSEWPKAIFYDSKNTLFDWDTVWIKAASNIVNYRHSSVDAEEFKKTWHKFLTWVGHEAAFSEYRDYTDLLQESLVNTFKYYGIHGSADDVRFMLDLWDKVQPFPDVIPALSKQKQMTKILIFSNVETRHLETMVNKLGGFRPDFIGDMQKARALKPSLRAYYWVLENAQLEVGEVLYCARPQWDVQGAIACGMKTAWLNRAREKLKGVKPHYEVKDLYEFTEVIERGKAM